MALLVIVFLMAALFFGLGFAVNWFFVVAALLAVAWLLGFVVRGPGPRAHWYRW